MDDKMEKTTVTIRDETSGKYLAGNKSSPGRRKRVIEINYLQSTIDTVSLADWQKVVRKALKDAIAGNGYARAWLSDYLIGKPPQILELRGGDAKLLADVLDQFKARGIAASDVFLAMLHVIAEDNADGQ